MLRVPDTLSRLHLCQNGVGCGSCDVHQGDLELALSESEESGRRGAPVLLPGLVLGEDVVDEVRLAAQAQELLQRHQAATCAQRRRRHPWSLEEFF